MIAVAFLRGNAWIEIHLPATLPYPYPVAFLRGNAWIEILLLTLRLSIIQVAFLRGSAWIEISCLCAPRTSCRVAFLRGNAWLTLIEKLFYPPRHPLTIPSHQKRTANSRIPQLAVLLFPLIISTNSIHSHQSDKTTAATPIPTNITPPNFVLNRYNSDGSSA